MDDDTQILAERAAWVWRETLRLHGKVPETRVASSLSLVEVLVCLFYGGVLRFRRGEPLWTGRDRLIISKGHGAVSMYPILADIGFFPISELDRMGETGSRLGAIPDPIVPGFETANGSLGHGLGVGCGMAMGLRRKGMDQRVFVVLGDGELNEGSVWEAAMFASHHKLRNLIAVLDRNQRCILGDCEKVVSLEPLEDRFRAFGWDCVRVPGHDMVALKSGFRAVCESDTAKPRLLIADTVKGRGVPELECDPLCHVKSLSPARVAELIGASA